MPPSSNPGRRPDGPGITKRHLCFVALFLVTACAPRPAGAVPGIVLQGRGSLDILDIALDTTESHVYAAMLSQFDVLGAEGCSPTSCFQRNSPNYFNTIALSKIALMGDDGGTAVWTKMWDTEPNVYNSGAQGVCVDGSNDVFVVGYIHGNRLAGYSYPVHAANEYNSFVIKVRGSDGVDLWATDPVYVAERDLLYKCAVDSAGDVYAVGATAGAMPGHTYGGGPNDGIVVKLSGADGSTIWTYEDSHPWDGIYHAVVMGATNLWIAGHNSGQMALVEMSPAAAVVNTRVVDGALVIGKHVQLGSGGTVYVLADSYNSHSGLTVIGEWDVTVFKYNSAGAVVWARMLGSPLHDFASGLALSPDEASLHVAICTNTLITGPTAYGQFDVVYYHLDTATGATVDHFQFGTSGNDLLRRLVVDASNHVYIGGMVMGGGRVFRVTSKPLCPAGSEFNVARDQPDNWNLCGVCPGNSVSAAAASTGCTQCQPGFIKDAANTTCTICPANTAQQGFECVPCAGALTSAPGSIRCLACSIGYFGNENSVCEACPVGSYGKMILDVQGNSFAVCETCPNESTTYSSAVTSRALCTCLENQYGNPLDSTGNSPCRDCPPNSECNGGLLPRASPGFYLKLSAVADGGVRCIPASACPGGVEECSEGYAGDSCSSCASGYFNKQGVCTKCLQNNYLMIAALAVTVPLGVVVLCGVGLFWVCSKSVRRFRRALLPLAKSLPALVRICALQVAFLQILQTTLTMGIDINIPFSDSFSGAMSFVSLDTSSLTSTECASGSAMTYAHKYVLKLILPVVLFGGMSVLVLLGAASKGMITLIKSLMSKTATKAGGASAGILENPLMMAFLNPLLGGFGVVLMTLNTMYYAIHVSVLDPMRCSETSGKWVVTSTPSVTCYVTDGDWIITLPFMVLGALVYSIGVPLFFLVVTIAFANPPWRHNSIISKQLFNFLWEKYETCYCAHPAGGQTELFFWECVITTKKMFVGIAAMCIVTGSYDQGASVFYILLLALVLHSLFRPFKSAVEDYLELVSLVCALLLVLLGIVSKSDSSGAGVTSEMSQFLEILGIMVIMFQGAFCLVAVAILVFRALKQATGHHNTGIPEAAKEMNPFEDTASDLQELRDRRDRLRQELKKLRSKLQQLS